MFGVDVVLIVGFIIIGFLVISTNVCSLLVLHKHRDVFEEVPRLLCLCVGVVDLIGGVSGCLLYIICYADRECFRFHEICRVLSMMFYISLLFSAIILSFLNIDRYIAISKPLRYASIVKVRSTVLGLCFVVCIPLAFTILGFIPGSPVQKLSNSFVCFNETEASPNLTATDTATLVTMYTMSLVPIQIGLVVNMVTMYIATRQARAIAALAVRQGIVGHGVGIRRIKLKGVKTILLISIVNWVAWLPAVLRLASAMDTGFFALSKTTDALLAMLFLVNFWSNSLVFFRTNLAYRRAAENMFPTTMCKRSRNNGP